eukprot:gnl/TRDRNA2_/TRDRNA2_156648_c1_seq2.p1 gnl/TRDRNA2_/TRDRNA2_156648_c1~~gnl/TRDRNA2_/TRDRNA2_156648_c1_seq2.p1  ORF type:complete len:616 (+),score=77.53 gnl/TRDRNA2_/TRDRNA2_156648_c1_seq2:55-1902(+)
MADRVPERCLTGRVATWKNADNAAAWSAARAAGNSQLENIQFDASRGLSQFLILKGLGKGAFASVRQAVHRTSGKVIALKVIKKESHEAAGGSEAQLAREAAVQTQLRHPYIVQLYGHFEDHAHVYLVLEYVDGGQLLKQMKERGKLPVAEAARFWSQVAEGLIYLHAHGVIHRDIKPENVLLRNVPGGTPIAKIGDFGCCATLTSEAPLRQTVCGTMDYLAPEMIDNDPYDHTVDVWAMGVLLYEMLAAEPPFKARTLVDSVKRILSADLQVPSDAKVSREAADLLHCLLQRETSDRIPLAKAVMHPFVGPHATLSSSMPGASAAGGANLLPRTCSEAAFEPKKQTRAGQSYPAPTPRQRSLSPVKLEQATLRRMESTPVLGRCSAVNGVLERSYREKGYPSPNSNVPARHSDGSLLASSLRPSSSTTASSGVAAQDWRAFAQASPPSPSGSDHVAPSPAAWSGRSISSGTLSEKLSRLRSLTPVEEPESVPRPGPLRDLTPRTARRPGANSAPRGPAPYLHNGMPDRTARAPREPEPNQADRGTSARSDPGFRSILRSPEQPSSRSNPGADELPDRTARGQRPQQPLPEWVTRGSDPSVADRMAPGYRRQDSW